MNGELLWSPPDDLRSTTEVGRYMQWLEEHRGLRLHRRHGAVALVDS